MPDAETLRRARARFVTMLVGLVLVGAFGYLGFAVVASGRVAAGVVGLGAATGFAAFFSPCSFPLLLTFLTKRSGESAREGIASAGRVAGGVAALLTLIAIAVVLTGDAIAAAVAFDSVVGRLFRALIGFVLVVMGAYQAHLIKIRLRAFDRIATTAAGVIAPRPRHRWVSDLVYGFSYLLAGFGCTGPLLAGLAAQSLTVGAPTTLWAFAAAVGVFTLLILVASAGVALGTGDALRAIRMVGPSVRRWSGFVLIGVGVWFVTLAALPSPLL